MLLHYEAPEHRITMSPCFPLTGRVRVTSKPGIGVFGSVSVEGGEPRQVTTHPAYDQLPTWSPDWEMAASDTGSDRKDSLRRVPALGGEA